MSSQDERRFRASGGELAYLDLGDPGDPAVVLLHGFPASRYLWRTLAPLLEPWMRVVAVDLLGAGDSEKAEGADLGVPAQARAVRELLDGVGAAAFAVVGHGVGGGVAQLLAVEGGARALVLIDTVVFDAWPSAWVRDAQQRVSIGGRIGTALVEAAFEVGVRKPGRLTPEDLAEYRRPFEGEEGDAAFDRWLCALDGAGLAGREQDLERLEIPTLVLWGEEDAFHPPALAERVGDVLPMASIALLPGCGHFLLEDAAETVAPLVFEYLRSRFLGAPHAHDTGPVTVELGLRPPERPEEET
ncbi:MAG TPA: alpha/beta hydrolase [Actinomycetota bacterium]|nr:alpha/beta hydrolase [Actinomycetota bacterium]